MFLSMQPYGFKVELLLIALVKTEERHCTTQVCSLGSTSHDIESKLIHQQLHAIVLLLEHLDTPLQHKVGLLGCPCSGPGVGIQ